VAFDDTGDYFIKGGWNFIPGLAYNITMFKDFFRNSLVSRARLIYAIKVVLAFMLGILAASFLGLGYAYTAGVIAVLGLEQSRRRSLRAAVSWLLDALLALGLASLLFHFLGFRFWVLIIFIAVLVPLSHIIGLQNGIVISLVLISQIYLEQDIAYALNALFVLLVGIGIAFSLNLYMPKFDREIDASITKIDVAIDEAIQDIASGETPRFPDIVNLVQQVREKLFLDIENHYFVQTSKRSNYLTMRNGQIHILERIAPLLAAIEPMPEKTVILDFVKTFKGKIGTPNFAQSLKHELDALFEYFRQSPLPDSRAEFEKRAQLYYVLRELENFLILKINYHENP